MLFSSGKETGFFHCSAFQLSQATFSRLQELSPKSTNCVSYSVLSYLEKEMLAANWKDLFPSIRQRQLTIRGESAAVSAVVSWPTSRGIEGQLGDVPLSLAPATFTFNFGVRV